MNEIENNKQKPTTSKLAIWSLLLAVFALLLFINLFILAIAFEAMTDFIGGLFIGIIAILLLASITIGILAIYKIRKSQGKLKGIFLAILGIIIALLLFMVILIPTCNK